MTDLKINGWTIYLHPLFIAALNAMLGEVKEAKAADPQTYLNKRCAKLLAATRKMAFQDLPANPSDPKFRLGASLGDAYKHWFRGKYVQQDRLFFRYDQRAKVIVLASVNDDETKRACGSRTGAYRVLATMLHHGNPPDDWDALLKAAQQATEAETPGFLAGRQNDPP